MKGFYFGADTSREYRQGNHDQRNAGIVYSIKLKRLIIMNMIIHQSVYIWVMYDGFMWNYSNWQKHILWKEKLSQM